MDKKPVNPVIESLRIKEKEMIKEFNEGNWELEVCIIGSKKIITQKDSEFFVTIVIWP